MKSELLSSSIQLNHFLHNIFHIPTPRTLVINNARPQSSIFCINKASYSQPHPFDGMYIFRRPFIIGWRMYYCALIKPRANGIDNGNNQAMFVFVCVCVNPAVHI